MVLKFSALIDGRRRSSSCKVRINIASSNGRTRADKSYPIGIRSRRHLRSEKV